MKKIVFVVHCILNTRTMVQDLTTVKKYPGNINDVVEVLIKNKVGVIQLPCPEKAIFGLNRERNTKTAFLKDQKFIKVCEKIANNLIREIKDYQRAGFKTAFILGKRGSPSCGVVETHIEKDGRAFCVKGKGILFEIIEKKLRDAGLNIPLIDFEHEEVKECLEEIKSKLSFD